MFRWQAHKAAIQALAFDPRGELIATATGSSKFVHLWDRLTGRLARKLDAALPVQAVAFAPDAPLVAAATARSAVRVWETGGWARVADLDTNSAFELAFGPGQKPVLAASPAGFLSVWLDGSVANENGPRPTDKLIAAGGSVACLDFTPDGRLGTHGLKETVLWDPAAGTRLRTWPRPETGNRGPIKFSPDGRLVAYAHTKFVVVAEVDPPAEHPLAPVMLTGHKRPVWAIGWAQDGRTLMTTSGDGTARLWDAASGTELRALDWEIGKIYSAAFAPDGLTCAAGGENGQVVVWDADG